MMRSNARKPDSVRPRPNSVTSGDEAKQVRKVQTRKVPYRVGYSWNKGGRLKELRIRHLARKFLKIWMQNTFGRILPHIAKSHYKSLVLRRAFEGWRDEWWTSRREWSLTMRAECHYRYHLYNLAFHSWRAFTSLQRVKKSKIQDAQSFADRQRMRLVWDRWDVFTEMRRMKSRMIESALELNRLTTLHSAWSLWQARLQQHQDLYVLEGRAVKQAALTLQRRTWLQWKEMQTAACLQREKEHKAALHFILSLKRKTLHGWKSYVSLLQYKKNSQAVAERACRLRLVMMCWSRWRSALHHKRREEDRLQAAQHLAVRSTQRRALELWKAYVTLCREECERNRTASRCHHRHLLRAGLQGLSLNVIMNKTQRLNSNMAVQHYCQTMISKYWNLWQDRLEEAEDESFQTQREMALAIHRKSLLSSCFHQWREKLAEQKHMQELEHRADMWFAERMLPPCLNSWVELTQQRRLHEQRRLKAEDYNRQRQRTWVFYTWWRRFERHKEQMLSERVAILHEERCHVQRAWGRWRQRTEEQMDDKEKQAASDHLYLHSLLHKTMTQWKDNSTEIRDRRNREQWARHQGDLCCMRWAVDKWKQFVRSQREKKSRLKQMQRYHELKLLKHAFVAWKNHHLQMYQIYHRAHELYRQQQENSLRKALSVWGENAVLSVEVRLMEQQAQHHLQRVLQLKVFLAWRDATAHAVSKRHQQAEAVIKAQRSINQVQLLQSFRQWRRQAREARRERICTEKARRHHESKLLSKAMNLWNEHLNQNHKNKVMKRQGILLLRLKMYQTYFEQWRVKLQRRRREAEQTEQALWHWALALQAKVLYGWRLWVTEQRRKQEQAARAAQVYRDQLLRKGVTCILTYATHMNDLTTSLTQYSQEQRSRHIQRVVKRCAMRWKQRALCKPRREQEVKKQLRKKSVSFCLTTSRLKSISPSDSAEQEDEDEELTTLPLNRTRRHQPCRCEELVKSPLKMNTQKESSSCLTVTSCLHPAKVPPVTSTHQSAITSYVSPSEPPASTNSPQETKAVLLPPSAFMGARIEDVLGKTSSSDLGDDQLVPPFRKHSSAYADAPLRASSGETAATDPTSALINELLSIQLAMNTYQQDRKQLRTWQRLKEVLQSWLQTSGKDEQMEKNAVCQELKELEESIDRLSSDLAQQKPLMLLHVERIQHLHTALTDHSVFTTSQQTERAQSNSDDTC